MIDAAIWLLRWTLAGMTLSAIVIAAMYVLERKGAAIGIGLFRAALVTALVAPMVALMPPLFTFASPGTAFVETDRVFPKYMEKKNVEAVVLAGAEAHGAAALVRGAPVDALAAAVLGLWAAGAAFVAISRQRSASRLSRAFKAGAPFPSSAVECRLSRDAPTPLLFGVFSARMLAPADFGEWPEAEREAVLSHEAAHARRGDLVWAFAGDVARILYWWAPPVRFLVSQHMLATEEACDAASFARDEDRHDYARTLLAVARRVGGHASPGLAMTASSLRRRIESLASPRSTRSLTSGLSVVAAGAVAFTLALTAPAAAADQYRIYIFNPADGKSDIYALSDGAGATAAIVEQCAGRLMPNAAGFVDEMEARLEKDDEDELSVVWVVGLGSKTELGPCHKKDENARDADSLVLITDASEEQARRMIRQIHGLSKADRQQMAAELGLDQ